MATPKIVVVLKSYHFLRSYATSESMTETSFFVRRPILQGQVNFPVCLAPMVGLTHVALRLVVRDYLPQGAFTLWPTEMLNSRRIPGEDLAKTPETMRSPVEQGLVPQILGNEESFIAQSVDKLERWGAVGIDINMGCPVQKALKHNYGVALMGDPGYASEVVRMTVKNTHLPVSVKLRAGSQNNFEYLYRFVAGLREAGASWVCLHPRTAEQKRRGSADWEQIQRLREKVDIPVIGNGDLQTAEDVFQMLEQTQCDLTMAGRALAARPWMLWQVGERLGFAPPPMSEALLLGIPHSSQPGRRAPQTSLEEGAEYGKCLLRLIASSREYFGEDLALRKIRFYVRMTSVWLLFGQALISVTTKAKNLSELETGVQTFFSNPVEMLAKTQLRE
jgi:tRNA-dihydrouridine synthase